MAISDYNPFAKREKFSSTNLLAYKILTIVSWLLVVIVGVYYAVQRPHDCHSHHHHHHQCHTIWGQNDHMRTPFSLNSVVTSIYWIIVLILQAYYVRYLYSSDEHFATSAGNVGSHFILHNLLTTGFILLWVRGYFWQGEILLIANLFNLTFLYFRHNTYPRFIHIPIVSAPLAWTYVAILWDGAAMVHAHSLPARIMANICIWGIFVLGGFFLLAYKDYTMGFELAFLSLALALGQIGTRVLAVQWIEAFIIMGLLIVLSLFFGMPQLFGQDRSARHEGHVVDPDQERQPLLDDQ